MSWSWTRSPAAWLPATGSEGIQTLILPALALGIAEMAIIARLTRSEMVEVLQSDYVRTAEAKGLGRRAVVMGHAFRNSLILIGSALISTEYSIFSLKNSTSASKAISSPYSAARSAVAALGSPPPAVWLGHPAGWRRTVTVEG